MSSDAPATRLGSVPTGWEVCQLRDGARISSGATVPTPLAAEGQVVPIMGANGPIGTTHASNLDCGFLVGRVGACGELHRVDSPVWASDNTLTVVPNGHFTSDFLWHVLRAARLPALGTKNAQPLLTQTQLGEISLPQPPSNEQRRIAETLGAVDDAIERTREVIEQTRKLKGALLQDLLTNGLPGRHSEFKESHRNGRMPAEWELVRAGEVVEVTQGIALGPHREAKLNPTPYLRVANVQAGYLDLSEIKEIEASSEERMRYSLHHNDVLLVEGHANITDLGRACLVPAGLEHLVFQNHLFRIRTYEDRLDPRFFATWINSASGRSYFRIFGGTTSGLNTVGSGDIKRITLPLPPIQEQTVICDLLAGLQDRSELLAADERQLTAAKASLSQALLTGRVRLQAKEAVNG